MPTLFVAWTALAQVNSGSDGSDGALDYSTSLPPGGIAVINMADHPDGIYHYTSVNIPANVRVSFIPNANNTPVVWLVQGSCIISGTVDVAGKNPSGVAGGAGGPGGFRGGNGHNTSPGPGLGPGGGKVTSTAGLRGGNASFATAGQQNTSSYPQYPAGDAYGNSYLVPLIGGSGGSGGAQEGGAGGGGSILIAASDTIEITGAIEAYGGRSTLTEGSSGGGGSGGSVRLVTSVLRGQGRIDASGGWSAAVFVADITYAGNGRIRFDTFSDLFNGVTNGQLTRGFQPIIIPPPNQTVSLAIQSVAGVTVPANPTGSLTAPDVVVPGSQQNPIPIVVRCANIPLNTEVTVEVKPASGPTISAVGINNNGTQASSTATVPVSVPRGGGTIQAKAVSGIAGTLGASLHQREKHGSYADTGLTAEGEQFAKVEVIATLGSGQEIVYLTESGKRHSLPSR